MGRFFLGETLAGASGTLQSETTSVVIPALETELRSSSYKKKNVIIRYRL